MSDPADIRNFLRIDDHITTSGRLLPGDPARLAAMGARHVVNLALNSHPDALPNAAEEMAAAGLGYTHIPIPFGAPNEAHYRAFAALIAQVDCPVHIHCIINWRVSALLYRFRRDVMKVEEARARACMALIWDPEQHGDTSAQAWVA